MPVCASKRDVLELMTIRYFFSESFSERFLLHCFEPRDQSHNACIALLHFNKNEALKLQAICSKVCNEHS